jgi:hydroxyacylglutathione hydrolase
MKIEQIYTGCLAQGTYFIESNGEIAVIDPLREVQPYLRRADESGGKIKYILETHFHADFVSGHLELHRKTGAPIVFGPGAQPSFEAIVATDGEEFSLGGCRIKVLHTPGHTAESSCYLLIDEEGKEQALFTGDTLFIGDVGRPDLAQKSGSLTTEDLAGFLYDSLREKIMPLPDHLVIYPAHGAGSACGKNMSKETSDTLGHQKEVNYALQPIGKEQFIREVTDGLLPPPFYFPKNVALNKQGAPDLDTVFTNAMRPMSAKEVIAAVEEGALILDTRPAQTFKDGFIPRSVNIGIKGDFAPWVGTLITNIQQPLVLVTGSGELEEVVTRLSRVGYDQIVGYLEGGIDAWIAEGNETDQIDSISAEEFASRYQNGPIRVLDVRRSSEYEAEHIEDAISVPLQFLNEHMDTVLPDEPNYIHCAGGYRSMIAASILKARGFHSVIDVAGGFSAISKTSVPRTNFICPTSLK